MAVDQSISETRLNDETLSELGLTEQPFVENKKATRFSDSTSQKLRASLEQKLRFGQSLHLLTGEQGVGKSVFLSQLFKHCKSNLKPFVAKGDDNFSSLAFLAAVQYQLAGEASEYESIHDYVDVLIPHFEKLADDKMGVVLTIDDAHDAPVEEVAELINLMPAFFHDDGEATARLLLVGEPQLAEELDALADEFDDGVYEPTHTSLAALDEARIPDYLSSRLKQAGFTDAFPFTDKAISKIHRESNGLPGSINASAADYLNKVYTAAPAKAAGGGFLQSLGWPLVLLGTAAVGLIAWGLSMFFTGNDPDPVVRIDSTAAVVESEDSTIVATTDQSTDSPVVVESDSLMVSAEQTEDAANNIATDTVVTTVADNGMQAAETDNLLKPQDLAPQDQTIAATVENTTGGITESLNNGSTTLQETVTEVVDGSSEPVTDAAAEVITTAENAADTTVDSGSELLNTVNNTVAERAEQISTETETVAVADNLTENTGLLAPSIGEGTAEALPESVEVVIPGAANTAAVDNVTTSQDSDAAAVDSGGVEVVVQPGASQPTLTDDNGVQLNVDAADAAPAVARAVENERWVLFQDAGKFTVQLATSRERDYIIDLAQSLPVNDPVAIYPFLTTSSKNPVFGLLSGLYQTRAEAISAVENMAEDAKQFGVWIRPIGDLQSDIKARQ